MRTLKGVAGVLIGMAMLATAPSERAQAQAPTDPPTFGVNTDGEFTNEDPRVAFTIANCASNVVTASSPVFTSASYDQATRTVTANIIPGTPTGTYPLTITCQGQPTLNAQYRVFFNPMSSEIESQVGARVRDGRFTAEDPRITIVVENCRSNNVTASSSIFSSTSYDRDRRLVTARIKRGTRSGSYGIRINCRGQATLSGRIRILGTSAGGGGVGGGGGSTPRGGVDSGLGGTAGGSPTAGWLLLLPLLGAGGLTVVLRRRNAAGR